MKREHILVMAAAVGLSFGSGVVGVAVGAGGAQAKPNSSGSDFIYPKGVCTNEACADQWCPGMPLPCGSDCTGHPQYPNWDMSVCHDFMVGYNDQTRRPGSKGSPKSLRASLRETPGGARALATGRPSACRGSENR
jgi:hypothetical protein